jgi:nitrilase
MSSGSSGPFKVAAIQDFPCYLDLEATLAKSVSLIERSAALGARLVVFPETWAPGYPFWYWRISDEHNKALQKTFTILVKNSVRVPSYFTERLGKCARECNIHVVMGIQELTGSCTLFNSQIFFDNKGKLLGVHRKLVPTFAERMIWSQGNGSTLNVFDTDIGRLGGLICWEHFMPLARYSMYSKGMQISASCWPASRSGKSHLASQFMAFEGRCFVVHSAAYIAKSCLPAGIPILDELELPDVIFHGGSAILDPNGDYLTKVEYETIAIKVAEIDLDQTIAFKQNLDVVGHYARPEVFKLSVNTHDFASFEETDSSADPIA